jgi:hypothetical protein
VVACRLFLATAHRQFRRLENRTSATAFARATRSGWRKPAVAPRGECSGRNVINPQKPVAVTSANPNHGGLTFAALGCRFDRPPNSTRLLSHDRRFRHPRRADDRRSRKRAFVHSKNRFCFGRPSHRKPRAGGVSPPWGTSAVANQKRTSQAICRTCNQERGR